MSVVHAFIIWMQSWRVINRFPVLFVVFVLYHAMWGWLLFQTTSAVLEPLLPRIPQIEEHPDVFRLLIIEAQFLIMKTNVLQPLLLYLTVLIAIRMVLTPFLQAGLYYTLSDQSLEDTNTYGQKKMEITRFFSGIKKHWKSFWLIAACKWLILFLACAFWFPHLFTTDVLLALLSAADFKGMMLATWKPLAAIGGCILLIGSFTRTARFAVIEEEQNVSRVLSRFARAAFQWFCLLLFCWIALIFYVLLTSLTALASSLLLLLVLRQFGYVVQAALNWTEIRSQYVVWKKTKS